MCVLFSLIQTLNLSLEPVGGGVLLGATLDTDAETLTAASFVASSLIAFSVDAGVVL